MLRWRTQTAVTLALTMPPVSARVFGYLSVLDLPPGGHKDQVTDYTPSALYAGEVRSRSGCGPEPGLHDDEAPSEQCQARAEGTGAGLPSALRSRHPLAGAVVSGVELKSSVQ